MSAKRDQGRDRTRTLAVIAGGSRVDDDDTKKNWLGHHLGSGAAKIDELLLDGASREDLDRGAGRRAIQEHFHHLEKEHGLKIRKHDDGPFIFDV